MSVTEQQRRMLYERLSDAIGDEAATVLTDLLPFQPFQELVTRQDLAATTTMLRGEMAELRAELKGEMAELRGEMAELRGEMAELRGEMAELRGEFIGFKGEMKGEFYRWGVAVVAANAVGMITAILT